MEKLIDEQNGLRVRSHYWFFATEFYALGFSIGAFFVVLPLIVYFASGSIAGIILSFFGVVPGYWVAYKILLNYQKQLWRMRHLSAYQLRERTLSYKYVDKPQRKEYEGVIHLSDIKQVVSSLYIFNNYVYYFHSGWSELFQGGIGHVDEPGDKVLPALFITCEKNGNFTTVPVFFTEETAINHWLEHFNKLGIPLYVFEKVIGNASIEIMNNALTLKNLIQPIKFSGEIYDTFKNSVEDASKAAWRITPYNGESHEEEANEKGYSQEKTRQKDVKKSSEHKRAPFLIRFAVFPMQIALLEVFALLFDAAGIGGYFIWAGLVVYGMTFSFYVSLHPKKRGYFLSLVAFFWRICICFVIQFFFFIFTIKDEPEDLFGSYVFSIPFFLLISYLFYLFGKKGLKCAEGGERKRN